METVVMFWLPMLFTPCRQESFGVLMHISLKYMCRNNPPANTMQQFYTFKTSYRYMIDSTSLAHAPRGRTTTAKNLNRTGTKVRSSEALEANTRFLKLFLQLAESNK